MSHTVREKQKLLNRVRRIRGQLEAVERAIETESSCSDVMHLLSASRGGINSLLAEVLEDHIKEHLLADGHNDEKSRSAAAVELIDVVHSYFK